MTGSDSWEERRKVQEEQFFEKQNKAALERLKTRGKTDKRPSPITGEPMEQLTVMGVVVDRCPKSGGIWLDAGELEQIIKNAAPHSKGGDEGNWVSNFFEALFSKK